MLLLLLGLTGTLAAETPPAFPTVELLPNSKPLYASMGLDPWNEARVGYLLFDGSLEDGYSRLYLWIPGDREYDPPVARRTNVDMDFRPFEFRVNSPGAGLTGGEQALINWSLSYRRRSHGGRRFDYTRGVYVERDVTFSPRIMYTCAYGTGPRDGTTRPLARMPLSLSIPGEFTTVEKWEDLPRAARPWAELSFYMRRTAQREGRRAVVRFQAHLQHRSGNIWRDIVVGALPPEARVSLSISPYMKDPIFSEKIPYQTAFGDGMAVELPFSWYEYEWDFECPGLEARPRADHHVTLNPQPLGPFDFE